MLYLVQKGGPVMWLILGCSLLAGIIFLERLLHFHRAQINAGDFLKGIYNILRRNNVAEAVSICEDTPGPVAYLVRAAVLCQDESRETIALAVQEAGLAEAPRLERNLNLLLTIAQIAPLIGMMGTVLGMMRTLTSIELQSPLVHSGDLAAGLWQALITTAAGLAVAIPTYAAYNFLVSWVEAIILDMERASGEIITFLLNQRRRLNGEVL